MIHLTVQQQECVLQRFELTDEPKAMQKTWKRRSYAPMLVHEPGFQSLKSQLRAHLPDYTPVFDVIFESDGKRVPFHCDYESLGPFHLSNRAVKDSHFVSVHFNLTEDGGCLTVLPWWLVSSLHFRIIQWFGIFGIAHTLLNVLTFPLFALFSTRLPNYVGIGNMFNNARLHSVSSGKPRISYVVRLVRNQCVLISPESVERALGVSAACLPLRNALLSQVRGRKRQWADDVEWTHLSAS